MRVLCLLLLAALSCVESQVVLTQSEQSVAVSPGGSYKLTCVCSGSSLGNMYWIRQAPGKGLEWIIYYYSDTDKSSASSVQGRFTASKDGTNFYLHMNQLKPEDTAVYYCARWWGGAFDYWGKGTMVTVTTAAPSGPSSLIAMSQCQSESSDFLTVGCMAKGFFPSDSLTFKWTDPNGTVVTDFDQYPAVGANGDYTRISSLRVRKSTWSVEKKYKCEASNSAGKKDISVAPPAPPPVHNASVFLTAPTQADIENGNAVFVCVAKQFSPKVHSFKWFMNDNEMKNITDSIVKEEKNGSVTLYSAMSVVQIEGELWKHQSTKIKCEFHHNGRTDTREVDSSSYHENTNINLDVEIIPPSVELMLKNRTGFLKCIAKADKSGFNKIEITQSGKNVAELLKNNIGEKKILEIDAKINFVEWSNETFNCVVEHDLEASQTIKTYKRENGGRKKRPTVFLLAPPEHRQGDLVTLTCYVKDFYPKEVFVSWLADDEQVNTNDVHNYYTSSLRASSYSMYSQIKVDYSQWKNGMVYSCVVYHESIEDNMRVLTKSIQDGANAGPSVINLTLNVSALSCK